MGLFLAPTSGNAVGGGGHNLGDPPPPGIDVDNVNREPLRLLRRTMNKHVPKRLKIVPPGLQRGMLAPPYAWDALERDDWKYELPKRSALSTLKEALPGRPAARPAPHAMPKPAPHQAPKPAAPHPAAPAAPKPPKAPDPRTARVVAITNEIARLRGEIQQLMAHQKQLTQAGKAALAKRPSFDPHASVQIGGVRNPLRIKEAFERKPTDDEVTARIKKHTPGPAERAGGMRWINRLGRERDEPLGLRNPTSRDRRQTRKADSERLYVQRQQDQEKRAHAQPPQQSAQIIAVHGQIAQKQQQIAGLVNELKQLRMQMKQTHESYRLTSNNMRRLSLLLK